MGALNLPSAGDLERLTRRVRSVSSGSRASRTRSTASTSASARWAAGPPCSSGSRRSRGSCRRSPVRSPRSRPSSPRSRPGRRGGGAGRARGRRRGRARRDRARHARRRRRGSARRAERPQSHAHARGRVQKARGLEKNRVLTSGSARLARTQPVWRASHANRRGRRQACRGAVGKGGGGDRANPLRGGLHRLGVDAPARGSEQVADGQHAAGAHAAQLGEAEERRGLHLDRERRTRGIGSGIGVVAVRIVEEVGRDDRAAPRAAVALRGRGQRVGQRPVGGDSLAGAERPARAVVADRFLRDDHVAEREAADERAARPHAHEPPRAELRRAPRSRSPRSGRPCRCSGSSAARRPRPCPCSPTVRGCG